MIDQFTSSLRGKIASEKRDFASFPLLKMSAGRKDDKKEKKPQWKRKRKNKTDQGNEALFKTASKLWTPQSERPSQKKKRLQV